LGKTCWDSYQGIIAQLYTCIFVLVPGFPVRAPGILLIMLKFSLRVKEFSFRMLKFSLRMLKFSLRVQKNSLRVLRFSVRVLKFSLRVLKSLKFLFAEEKGTLAEQKFLYKKWNFGRQILIGRQRRATDVKPKGRKSRATESGYGQTGKLTGEGLIF
jgi:hypothetical protein